MTDDSYREKQHRRYVFAMTPPALRATALDALWRAASHSDFLASQEHSYTELTPARVTELLTRLGWE